MSFKKVVSASELWNGEKRAFEVDGTSVLLVKIEGTVLAYENKCPHQSVALSEGRLNGRVLICRAHQWEFDVCTGLGLNPHTAQLKSFRVQVSDDSIFVDVDGC